MAVQDPAEGASTTSSDSPRFRICAVLAAHGASNLETLIEKTGIEKVKVKNALYLSKKAGVLRRLNQGLYEITDQGRRFLQADFADADKKFGAKGKAEMPARSPVKPKPAQSLPETHAGFYCAIFSDGRFMVSLAGLEMTLSKANYEHMVAYQQRVQS